MSETVDEGISQLSTVIELPAEQKAQLKVLCTRRGIAMRDYVEQLVRAGLAIEAVPEGRKAMASAAASPHAEFEDIQHCKYGCNYHTKSKSGLSQHEATCTFQRSQRAQERAARVEAERRVEQAVLA